MDQDPELLRSYAVDRSEKAFAELVRRHLDLVYGVALRQVGGDEHLAKDVAQVVFTSLARKADKLARRAVLGGWLYRTTQFAAINVVRAESRRRVREAEARTMDEHTSNPNAEADWEKLRPTLDEVIGELRDDDRDAVVLRFFEGKSFAELGARLRMTDNAARMRVERALGRMRERLAKRGVTSTTVALAMALGNQVSIAAPTGMAASVSVTALAGAAASSIGWMAIFMGITKIQIGIACATALACATGYLLQGQSNAELRREIAALRENQQALPALRAENERLASTAAEVEALRRDDLELKQLAQSAAEAKTANEEKIRLARVRENEQNARSEITRMNQEGNALVEGYRTFVEASTDGSLTAEARAEALASAEQAMLTIKAKQLEIKATTERARASGLLPASRGKWVPPISAREGDGAVGATQPGSDNLSGPPR